MEILISSTIWIGVSAVLLLEQSNVLTKLSWFTNQSASIFEKHPNFVLLNNLNLNNLTGMTSFEQLTTLLAAKMPFEYNFAFGQNN